MPEIIPIWRIAGNAFGCQVWYCLTDSGEFDITASRLIAVEFNSFLECAEIIEAIRERWPSIHWYLTYEPYLKGVAV